MPTYIPPGRVLLLVAATACWGIGTVVTKQVLDHVAALTLLPLQLAASCLLLAALTAAAHARRRRSRDRISWSPQMTKLTALGILNPGAAYALGLLGLTSITASMSVLLWAVEPVLILLLAATVLRESIPGVLMAGLALGLVGMLLVVYRPGATGDAIGVALTLAAVTACAIYTVLTSRLLLDDASLTVVLAQQAAALGFAVLLATATQLSTGQGWELEPLDVPTWIGAVASGMLYYGLAFWFFIAGLRQMPASAAGAFLPLTPVFGITGGFLIGDRLDARQWLGAGIVIAATTLIALRHGPPAIAQPRDSASPTP